MNITGAFSGICNKAKMSLLSGEKVKEVTELCDDITKNTSYKNLKIDVKDRNNVRIVGSKENSQNSLTIDMDFANNIQNQIEKTKGYVFTIIHPYRESVQEIRGTLDGVMKRARTTNVEKNKEGTSYVKTTDYQNFISGNYFRREETPGGVKFYRNIDGDFVEMFSKK